MVTHNMGYRRLADDLLARIEAGSFPTGRLPAEQILAHESGVARGTIRRALQQLIDQGHVVTSHGRGHFVVGGAQSPTPRYSEIASKLANRFRGGLIPEKGSLTEAAVVREFGVSRTTARRALSELEASGLIERLGGRRHINLSQVY
jgi:DNA-binding GntR family transcriptional regulator